MVRTHPDPFFSSKAFIMSENADLAVDLVFTQYRQNGLGHYANWLTMKMDNVDRTKVVEALKSPATRKAAEKLLDYFKFKVEELQSMLLDSEPPK